MRHTLGFAIRALRQQPAFAAAAALTLALGIGLNTTIFAIVNTFLFRPLPVQAPQSLVWILSASPDPNGPRGHLTYPDVRDFGGSPVLAGATAYAETGVIVSTGEQAARASGQLVRPNYFDVMGVRIGLGRPLSLERDDDASAPPVAVISDRLARRLFVRADAAVGLAVSINGRPFTIVGIAPPGFSGAEPLNPSDVWVPLARHEDVFSSPGDRLSRHSYWLRGIGRLSSGVSRSQAEAGLRVTAGGIAQAFPKSHPGFTVELSPMRGVLPSQRGEVFGLSAILLGVSLTVLLVACANVANLQLVRSAGRSREIAIRLAMGATRGDLVRLLLSESAVLAISGAALALLLALWTTEPLLRIVDIPISGGVAFDGRVVLFTTLLAVVTTMVFGLVPARRASRLDVVPGLREGQGSGRHGASRLQRSLVVVQLAISLVLITAAALLARSLQQVQQADVGFDWRNRVALEFNLRLQGYTPERADTFQRLLLERAQALPGVRSVSLARTVPLGDRLYRYEMSLPDAPDVSGPGARVFANFVGTGFFETLDIRLVRGRSFRADDMTPGAHVAVINEAMVRRYWSDRDPLGQRFGIEGADGPFVEVIGVARDVKQDELIDPPQPFAYLPYASGRDETALIAWSTLEGGAILRALEAEVHALDPNIAVEGKTMAQHIAGRVDTERGLAKLIGLFGLLAVALALVGLYGVMAFTVRGRTREIGVRLAIGARHSDVVRQFVIEGLRLAGLGLAVGLPLAIALSAVLSSSLVGVRTADPVTFTLVLSVLTSVAVLAAYLPAARAARVDPLVALRHE